MAKKKTGIDDMTTWIVAGQASRLDESARKSLAAAEELGIENKPFVIPLGAAERAMLAALPELPEQLRQKLTGRSKRVTVADATGIVTTAANSFVAMTQEQRTAIDWAVRRILFCIHNDVLIPAWRAQAKKRLPTSQLYQLKITLVDIKPAIWRRIQIRDCTFDRLHEHIQTTMGWTNSHLHHFEVGEQLYGDPALLEENFYEMNYRDSTITLISSVLSKEKPGLSIRYEYDFGDSWEHEVLFEGCPEPVPGQRYPVCLEGHRACPPEDVGGVDGYAEFLKTIRGENRKARIEMLEWAEGWFDPEEFDQFTATKSMWKGIFDWRSLEG